MAGPSPSTLLALTVLRLAAAAEGVGRGMGGRSGSSDIGGGEGGAGGKPQPLGSTAHGCIPVAGGTKLGQLLVFVFVAGGQCM